MGDSNGRLLRVDRGPRRGLVGVVWGLIRRSSPRWMFAACLFVVALPALAISRNDYPDTQAGQYQYCQDDTSYNATYGHGAPTTTCALQVQSAGQCYYWSRLGDGSLITSLTFAGCDTSFDPARAVCTGRPEIVVAVGTDTSYNNAGCVYAPFGDTPHTVCIDASGEHYCTGELHLKPTGDYTSATPPAAADPVPPPPKACGGGSCYDPSAGKYCAMSGGAQLCVAAGASNPSGGCATSGDVTLCAGSPAPLPPLSAVHDPATDIGASDTYRDGSGGSTSVVVVNNYDTSGGAPQSGQTTGDVGVPPQDTNTGDKTAASGGGDCASPPVVEGNAALGMISRQVWLARCQGDGGQSNDGDTTVPGLDGVGEVPGPGFITEGTLLDKLDGGGFGGGGQCPAFPDMQLDALGVSWNRTPDWWCDLLNKLSYLIAGLGAFASLAILGAFKR